MSGFVNVIAEAGMCANSVEWAHAAVDAAADAGCWGLKVQLLNPDTITAKGAERYDRLAGAADQYEAFRDALPYEAWPEVFDHARERRLVPFASCWDEAAVEFAEAHLRPDWYKIGSADITHLRLVEKIGDTGKGVMLSTGAASEPEIGEALGALWGADRVVLMACTLSYPCDWRDARVGRVGWLRDRFGWVEGFGYSDHTRDVVTGMLAVAAGAGWLEKHFTVTPGAGGDHDFALTPAGMAEYVTLAESAWTATNHPEGMDMPLESELPALRLARRSLHTTAEVACGERLVIGVNCAMLRPGTGQVKADSLGPWYAPRDYKPGEQV